MDNKYLCGRAVWPVVNADYCGPRIIFFNSNSVFDDQPNQGYYDKIRDSYTCEQPIPTSQINPLNQASQAGGSSTETNYEQKYLKYKRKYITLRRALQTGGGDACPRAIKQSNPVMPGHVSKDSSYVDNPVIILSQTDAPTRLKMIDHLKTANDYDTLILKLGANDTHPAGKKIVPAIEEGLFGKLKPNFAYEDNEGVANLATVAPKKFMKIVRKLGRSLYDRNIMFVDVDPEQPSDWPFNDADVNISKKLLMKAYFPLARGSTDGDAIINELVNYKGDLILINAIGGVCYNSIKEIIDKRKALGKNVEYLMYVNEPTDAICYMNEPIYSNDNKIKECNPNLL